MTSTNLAKNRIFLEMTPKLLNILISDLPEEVLITKFDEEWTPFDVVGHMIHNEDTDWIPRAKIILYGKDKRFEPFDRTAMFEKSKGKTAKQLLAEFESKRAENLKTLDGLPIAENLKSTGIHPTLGEVNLEQLLATWVAHDLSHLYQILRVLGKPYKTQVGPWAEYLRILRE